MDTLHNKLIQEVWDRRAFFDFDSVDSYVGLAQGPVGVYIPNQTNRHKKLSNFTSNIKPGLVICTFYKRSKIKS